MKTADQTITTGGGHDPHATYAVIKCRLSPVEIVAAVIATAGAARFDKVTTGCTGDAWQMLACIDRLVELGELVELHNPLSAAGQHRLFISKKG